MTHPISPSLVLSVLQHVSLDRLQKAAEGLATHTYTITLTHTSEREMRGFVANGEGKQYGAVPSEGQSFCSCPDSMYRQTTCKHQVALALSALRQPEAREEPASPPTRCIHITRGMTPSAPPLCGAVPNGVPSWVVPCVPESPAFRPGEVCETCWTLYTQPALRAAA